jgi:ADP-ribosylation factor related protein 1
MFGLLYGLWQYLFTKQEVFILVIGLNGSGKTTFLEQLKALYKGQRGFIPPQTNPTVGLNIARVETSFGIRLTFWDLGGQKGLRSLWEKYMDEASACVFYIDSSSFADEVEEARKALLWSLDHPQMKRIPLLVVANKQDLPGARSPSELTRDMRFDELEMPIYAIQGMSAIQGKGVEEGMSWLIDQVLLTRNKE